MQYFAPDSCTRIYKPFNSDDSSIGSVDEDDRFVIRPKSDVLHASGAKIKRLFYPSPLYQK